MFIVKELNTKLIVEDRFRLFKRHLMFFEICSRLGLIPFKVNRTYIVFMKSYKSSRKTCCIF